MVGAFSGGSNATSPLVVQISPNAPPAAIADFTVVAEAPASVPARLLLSHPLNLLPVAANADDFEGASANGWTVGAPGDNATGGLWVRDDPIGTWSTIQYNPEDDHTPAPGVKCWFTGQTVPGSPIGAQDVDGITTLVSPVIDLSHVQNPVLSYWRWFATSQNDTFHVEMSNNGGATWSLIEVLSSTRIPWTQVEVPIESILPRTSAMRFRFRAADWPVNSLCEAGIDDFRVSAYAAAFDISALSAPQIGTTLDLSLHSPFWPGASYLLGCATTAQSGIPTAAGMVPLDIDWLFNLVPSFPTIFESFAGALDSQGSGMARIHIPGTPALSGFSFLTAGVVGTSTSLLATTGGLRLVIQ
jgi:hypothetical protein